MMERPDRKGRDEIVAWVKGHLADLAILVGLAALIILAIALSIEPPGTLVWAISLLAILNHYRLSWRERANASS